MKKTNPKVDPESPAAKIATKFDRRGNAGASGLANALSLAPSTVQRWLNNGAIPPEYHSAIVAAARAAKIAIRPEDFVDVRAFGKPSVAA